MTTIEEKLNRWAEKKYDLPNVESVNFEIEGGDDYGCETCGYGSTPPYVEVSIRYDGGRYTSRNETYAADLINSILTANDD